jgi:hypothetical protein
MIELTYKLWIRILIVLLTSVQTVVNALIIEHKDEIQDKSTKEALNMLSLACKVLLEKHNFSIPTERKKYLAEIIVVFMFLSTNLQDKVSEYITYLTNKKE